MTRLPLLRGWPLGLSALAVAACGASESAPNDSGDIGRPESEVSSTDLGAVDTDAADTDATGTDVGAPGPVEPTPWIFPVEPPEPNTAPDAATRAMALGQALDAALTLDPQSVRTLQDLLFPPPSTGSGDPAGCPFFLTYDYGAQKAYYWQGECTAASGTAFSGSGYATWFQDADFDGSTLTGFVYQLAGRIEAADGTWLEGAGEASDTVGKNGDLLLFGRGLVGTFSAGGPRAPASAWLSGTRRPTLRVDGWIYTPTGGRNLTFTGGLSGLETFPSGVTAVSLEGLTLRDANAGSPCPSEPGGVASVRTAAAGWVDVAFQGVTDAEPTPEAASCDGCGSSWFRGSDIGETCLNPAGYLDWQGERPW